MAQRILGLALAVLTASRVGAQTATPGATALPSAVPVTLTLHIAGDRRVFRPGETIPITLEFQSAVAKRFVVDGATYDRSGRLTIDEFHLEPFDDVSDPMLDYFASSGGFIGGGIRSMGVLGDKPVTVSLELNHWFRFDRPGRYTLSVRSQRVTDEAAPAAPARTIVPVTSNAEWFEVRPRDPEWEAETLRDAVALLNSRDSRLGCKLLRFLATDPAVDEMIPRFDGQGSCDFDYMAGLFASSNRERVVRRLEEGLRASQQPVLPLYLRTLATLSVYVAHPELRAPQTRDTKGRLVPSPGATALRALVDVAHAQYTDVLREALPQKTGRARALTLAGLLDNSAGPNMTLSARERLRADIAATFLDLPAERQTSALEYGWRSIASPAMLPALRSLVERPASGSLADIALRRLYELSPDEGRQKILQAIRNPARGATLKTLGLLPDRELAELDDILAARVEQGEGFDELATSAGLLHRYASSAPAARVLAAVGETLTRMACRPQVALLAYFLRASPETGRILLDRAMASRSATGCYRSALHEIAKLRMTPALEAAAVAHLDDLDPGVVRSAAEALGSSGSPSSRTSLRSAFERWHARWKGRADAIQFSHAQNRPDAAHGMLEHTFIQALGRARGWLTDRIGLEELRGLCVTDNCRTQTAHMIDVADGRKIAILRAEGPDDLLVMVAQYELTTLAALEQKLAQYPRGTAFTLDVTSLDPQIGSAMTSRLVAFGSAQGLYIRQ